MTSTVTFHGSHGALTCCAVSGHVIAATGCECGDCPNGYSDIALVDVSGSDPEAVRCGEGDILGAAVIMRDGRHYPAAQFVMDDDGRGGTYQDLLALPAPSADPEREIEVSLYAFINDRDGSRPIEPGERPDGYCVYTLDRGALGDGVHAELYDEDFPTLECAERAFAAQLAAFPDAGENVYAMPDRARESTTQAILTLT